MKERRWNKVRRRQSSLSMWRESQNCPSTKIYQTHTPWHDPTWFTLTYTAMHFFTSSPRCPRCAFTPLPSFFFLSLCVSLPYPNLSKDGQGCLNFGCYSHLLFIQLVHSSQLPPWLVFQLFPLSCSLLIHCCLPITTEVIIISWSHGQTVNKTQCGLDTQTRQSWYIFLDKNCNWLDTFFLCPRHRERRQVVTAHFSPAGTVSDCVGDELAI